MIDGEKVDITYTRNDGTLIQSVFDDDPESLYKSHEINPVIFDLTFPKEKEFSSIFIIHGSAPIELGLTFFSAGGDRLKSYTTQFMENGDQGNTLQFDENVKALRVTISVEAIDANELEIVHIWEIKLEASLKEPVFHFPLVEIVQQYRPQSD